MPEEDFAGAKESVFRNKIHLIIIKCCSGDVNRIFIRVRVVKFLVLRFAIMKDAGAAQDAFKYKYLHEEKLARSGAMELRDEKKSFVDYFVPGLAGALVFAGLLLSASYNYLLFHTLAELFSIAVAFAVFMLTWNSRRYLDNNYLHFIGVAYLFVGVLDLFHTVAYKGMNMFQGYDANLPTQLWIAGRYVQSVSFILATFVARRRMNYAAVFSSYAVLTALVLAAVFTGVFPACYIEGSGLTPFKIISEYVVSFMFAVSAALLLRMGAAFESNVLRFLVMSIAFTIGAELAFTFYVSVYGLSNLTGHCFKIVAYYLVYKAIVATGLKRPYDLLFRDLKQSEAELRKYRSDLETLVQERTLELKRTNKELEHEVTERKETERRITWSNTLLKLLSRISSRKAYLDAVVKLVAKWSGCRCVGIRVLNEDRTIPYESYIGFSREFWESENWLSADRDQCVCIRVITGKSEIQDTAAMTPFGSFRCNDTLKFVSGLAEEQQSRFRGVCVRSGFASVAVIPVRYGDRIIAAVHLADERKGKVPREFIEFFETITPLIGEAIHKLDAEAERARLVTAIESAADAIAITDTGWTVHYVNPAFERVTGYARDEIVGRDLRILGMDVQSEISYDELQGVLGEGKPWSGRATRKKKDGVLYEEDVTIAPVRDSGGDIAGYISVKRDITEKIRLESIAEAVNTMNNIGYIVSGIRHEVGNPVNSIKMALNILKLNLHSYSPEAVLDYIERSLGELSRIEYLLRNLKSFNMYENPELQNVEIASFMDKLLSLVRDDFTRKGVSVDTDIRSGARTCHADPRALQQVLLNILANAADACEGREGAKILISVSNASGIILIRVADNGRGMTEEQHKDLFKPFYTTTAHGTGLGLVIARKMLAKMKGTIRVKSKPDEGTVADIFIPEGVQ